MYAFFRVNKLISKLSDLKDHITPPPHHKGPPNPREIILMNIGYVIGLFSSSFYFLLMLSKKWAYIVFENISLKYNNHSFLWK